MNCLPPIFHFSLHRSRSAKRDASSRESEASRTARPLFRSADGAAPQSGWRQLAKDTLHLSRKSKSSPTDTVRYQPQLRIGTYGLPPTHPHFEVFKAGNQDWNPPGVARIASVKSLDPTQDDPTQAYASEIMIDLKETKLKGKTMPGEHLSLLDTSNPKLFSPDFISALRTQGDNYPFTRQDFEKLGQARLKNFTIASPKGGERDADGRPNGLVKFIVRRVEYQQEQNGIKRLVKGPLTNYLVSRNPGDPLVFAAPISHHFLGPTARTPAIFFGVGSSVTPYESMLRTRFEQEKGPYADTYLAIGHTRQDLEYDRALFETYAKRSKNHFTYRPVFSREPKKSDGLAYVQDLIQKPDEARKIFALVLNPKAQIYISGFQGFDDQLLEALKKSCRVNQHLGVTEEQIEIAWKKAKTEDRLHVEGEIRQDLLEGLQGY